MAANTILMFLMSGQFWFAAFLSLLTAFLIEAGFGYGRGLGKGSVIYMESNRTLLELVGMFVVSMMAYSALIQATLSILS